MSRIGVRDGRPAGALDHVIYTAGEPLSLMRLPDITPEVARSFFETRYFGALAVVRAIASQVRDAGSLRSPLWSGMKDEERDGMYADVSANVPLGRVGEVEDAALAYLYAMNQTYGTGVVLPVDGGTVLA